MRVSLFKSCFDTSPLISKDVGYFLDRIRNGKHSELIAQIRATTEKEKRSQLKQTLPIVLFAGVFTKRAKKDLKSASGLIVLDFDNLPNIQEKKKELISLPYVFACWVSPSGDGLKALVKISTIQNDDEYKRYFNQQFIINWSNLAHSTLSQSANSIHPNSSIGV